MIMKKIETINKIIKFLDVPVMDIRTELCYNHSFSNSCSLCQDICPVHAIELSPDVPTVNGKDCVLCGACSTVCPNNVVLMIDSSDENIVHRINEVSSEFDCIRFQCNGCSGRFRFRHKKPPKNTGSIIVPCLGRLNETILLYGLLQKPGGMDFAPCNSRCPYIEGAKAFDESLITAGRLLNALNTEKAGVDVGEADIGSGRSPRDYAHGRRDFIIESGKRAIEIAFNMGEGDFRGSGKANFRRELLISLIMDNEPGNLMDTDDVPFAHLCVDVICDLCGLCERLCPSRALSLDKGEGVLRLNFMISKCTNCGICRSVCPIRAIKINDVMDMGTINREEECLREGKETRCDACGRSFYVPDDDRKTCTLCLKPKNLIIEFGERARGVRTLDD